MKDVPEKAQEPSIEWQKEPQCPICGNACEKIFRDYIGIIVGCNECIGVERSTEVEECYE